MISLKRYTPRILQATLGLLVLCAFAVVPMTAQAAANAVQLNGTIEAGPTTMSTPTVAAFTATLTGQTQSVRTSVGPWAITDASGGVGYAVLLAASEPTVENSVPKAGTEGGITFEAQTAAPAAGNHAAAPVRTEGEVPLSATGTTVEEAVAGTGQGVWNVPGDVVAGANEGSVKVTLGGDMWAGAYASTLTFTIEDPVS